MAGAERISLDFPGRVGSVAVVGAPEPGATDPSGTGSAEASRQMQELLDAEMDCLRSARAALEAAAAQLAESREKMIQQAESQLLELAIEIARKVLAQEIQAGRYEIEPIVKEALCHVPARRDAVIRLNPDDHARCEMARQSEEAGGGGEIRFIADPAVARAQCVVETPEGMIESSVEAHLEDVGAILRAEETDGDG